MRIFILTFLMLISSMSMINAEPLIDRNAPIAVMDFGVHKGTSNPDFDLLNAEQSTSEYVIQYLVDMYHFNIIDKDMALDKLRAENLNITGLIDPDTAKRIGEILGVKYIIYGNVVNVSLNEEMKEDARVASNATIKTVTANIVLRIMDVETGSIIMASKGTGVSQSSYVNALIFFRIGNVKVTQESVHNALKKSAFQAVYVLVKRLQC